MEQGQGDFAFAQVVAGRFADIFVGEVVEDVVAYLEAASEQFGEFGETRGAVVVGAYAVAAHLGAGHEERGCLIAYDIIV